ncbi:DUF3450 family protein [Pseudoteredinibacter isoporae]|uniref:DUF3450 family protein n=1 Tax=Pseudoteredinibacter isoporae TaxID=570281 RepID=UPI003102AE0C
MKSLLLSGLLILSLISQSKSIAQQSHASRLEGLMQQWLTVEQQREHMRLSWQEEKQVLNQRLELLNTECTELEKQLNKHSGLRSKAQLEREALASAQNTLESRQQRLKAALERAHHHINTLLPRLPAPLAEHWKGNLNKLTLLENHPSKRLDLYLDMYKSFDRFQEKVTLHQTLMPIANHGEQEILVDQIYLGVARGWYLSRDGQYAGYGEAGSNEWQWHSDNTLSDELRALMDATRRPEKATILPITLSLSGDTL